MNDFTKEELMGLLYMVITFINECEGGNKAHEMKNKLQAMIGNYPSIYCKCEGQWVCDECNFKE